MKNKEKFEKEIIEIACNGCRFGMDKYTGEIASCNYIPCRNCVFHNNADCSEVKREWAESEYSEKPKISRSDRAFLDYVPDDYKYMTRDEDGRLFVYKKRPQKGSKTWLYYSEWFGIHKAKVRFPMVKWEDEEPWLIEDLKKLEVVEEYEQRNTF